MINFSKKFSFYCLIVILILNKCLFIQPEQESVGDTSPQKEVIVEEKAQSNQVYKPEMPKLNSTTTAQELPLLPEVYSQPEIIPLMKGTALVLGVLGLGYFLNRFFKKVQEEEEKLIFHVRDVRTDYDSFGLESLFEEETHIQPGPIAMRFMEDPEFMEVSINSTITAENIEFLNTQVDNCVNQMQSKLRSINVAEYKLSEGLIKNLKGFRRNFNKVKTYLTNTKQQLNAEIPKQLNLDITLCIERESDVINEDYVRKFCGQLLYCSNDYFNRRQLTIEDVILASLYYVSFCDLVKIGSLQKSLNLTLTLNLVASFKVLAPFLDKALNTKCLINKMQVSSSTIVSLREARLHSSWGVMVNKDHFKKKTRQILKTFLMFCHKSKRECPLDLANLLISFLEEHYTYQDILLGQKESLDKLLPQKSFFSRLFPFLSN